MQMKKILGLFLLVALVFGISSPCFAKEDEERRHILKVYNWADYVDEDLLTEFETWYKEQTGEEVHVLNQLLDINEGMLIIIENGHEDYDVVCPSDYIIERMLKLVELGDAYVVLKGGTGTLLELAAVWEFINKKFMKERPGILIGNFWNHLGEPMREELIREGASDCTKYISQTSSPKECAEIVKQRLNRNIA